MDARRNDRKKRISSLHGCSNSKNRLARRDHSKANVPVKKSQPNCITELEQVPELSESPEKLHNASCKYNLRKSLAWDNAFFTSEGVLDPEELADVNRTFRKVYISQLPGIQEDARRSIESNGTLDSDIWGDENLEDHLFGNIRASIHRYQLKRSENPLPLCSSNTIERGKLVVAGILKPTSLQHQVKSSVREKKINTLLHSSTRQLQKKLSTGRTEESPPKISPIRVTSSSGSLPIRKNVGFTRKGNRESSRTPIASSFLSSSMPISSMKESTLAKTLIKKLSQKLDRPSSPRSTQTYRRGNAAVAASLSSGMSPYSSIDSSATESSSAGATVKDSRANAVRSSVKPSGLRPPSPKMGYFDAGRISSYVSSSRYTAKMKKTML